VYPKLKLVYLQFQLVYLQFQLVYPQLKLGVIIGKLLRSGSYFKGHEPHEGYKNTNNPVRVPK
jgi:hypothetical protein